MRLFTFGCSFTLYNWPTWADMLGYSFLLHQNWGLAGIGNRAIAERVAECHMINKFNKDDVVIVQWSNHCRNDYAKFDRKLEHGSIWCTLGGPTSLPNKEIYTVDWFKNFYDEKAYYFHTLNNIVLVQQLLESTGCKWYMTSMTDLMLIPKESENLTKDGLKINVFDTNPDLLGYKKFIWEDRADKWFPPLIEEKWRTPELNWEFNIEQKMKKKVPYFQTRENRFIEPHLTTRQYANYLNRVELDILLDNTSIKKTVDTFENIYQECENDWHKFIEPINSNGFNFTKFIFGK